MNMGKYDKKFSSGNVYDVNGRKARYWGTDSNQNQRRILVFFDIKTDECLQVSTLDADKIQRL